MALSGGKGNPTVLPQYGDPGECQPRTEPGKLRALEAGQVLPGSRPGRPRYILYVSNRKATTAQRQADPCYCTEMLTSGYRYLIPNHDYL